eukprot:1572666-Ditylum_brightwellii.AAC.1
MESPSDQKSIPDLLQRLYLDTLDYYVAPPAKSQTMEDLLLALRRKEYLRLQRAINNKTTNKEDDASTAFSS